MYFTHPPPQPFWVICRTAEIAFRFPVDSSACSAFQSLYQSYLHVIITWKFVAVKASLWSGKEMVAARCQIRAVSRIYKISTGSVAEIVELYFTAIKFIVIYLYMSLINIINKFLRRWSLKGLLSVWSHEECEVGYRYLCWESDITHTVFRQERGHEHRQCVLFRFRDPYFIWPISLGNSCRLPCRINLA